MGARDHLNDNFVLGANRLLLSLKLPEALEKDPVKVVPGLHLYSYKSLLFHPGVEISVNGSEFSIRAPGKNSCAVSALSVFLRVSFTGALSLLRGLSEASGILLEEGFYMQIVENIAVNAGAKKVLADDVPESFEENLEKFPDALFFVESEGSKKRTDHVFATYDGKEVCSDIVSAKEGGYKNKFKRIDSVFQKDRRTT